MDNNEKKFNANVNMNNPMTSMLMPKKKKKTKSITKGVFVKKSKLKSLPMRMESTTIIATMIASVMNQLDQYAL